MSSEKNTLLNYFARKDFEEGIFNFEDILKEAAINCLGKKSDEVDRFTQANINRFWNAIIKQQDIDKENYIIPLFNIVDEYSKKVSWIHREEKGINPRKHLFIKSRPNILRLIDSITDREYEALACVVCNLLGAKNILLTKSKNEAGIDFIASIDFSPKAHYLFGINGPLRIIGQCKKHNTAIQVNSMKEFNQTLNDVYSLTQKMISIIPAWFSLARGPIIGWYISHEGCQTGAISRARNYGIITSSSRDLAEIITCSKKLKPYALANERADYLYQMISNVLSDKNINMDLQ